MKYIFILSSILISLSSCKEESDLQYDMAGIYDITSVRQEVMRNGQMISTNEEETDGVLVLRQGKISKDSKWSLDLETTMTLVAWNEISGDPLQKWWDASQDDKRLSFTVDVLFAFNLKSLTFTIVEQKRKKLELMYVGLTEETNGDVTETFEYYTLELRD